MVGSGSPQWLLCVCAGGGLHGLVGEGSLSPRFGAALRGSPGPLSAPQTLKGGTTCRKKSSQWRESGKEGGEDERSVAEQAES